LGFTILHISWASNSQGIFSLNKLCPKKKGEFFLKNLEKLVEFVLEEEKISQNFPDILDPHQI
jgi:hypothetical protein